MINCHVLFSQENLVVFFADAITNAVPVYSCDTGIDCIATIKEDPEKENWHEVKILGQSNNRYKVRIIAINEDNVTPIDGWVDKEQCGVWLWGKSIKTNLWAVRLYHVPGQLYPFIKITDKYIDGFDRYIGTKRKAVTVLDYKLYNDKYWIKTAIIAGNKKVIGWTTDYCPNVYGSCN